MPPQLLLLTFSAREDDDHQGTTTSTPLPHRAIHLPPPLQTQRGRYHINKELVQGSVLVVKMVMGCRWL